MTLFLTEPPVAEPVTLAEAKAHLRIDHDSEDGLLEGCIRAAREWVEQETGLALITQSWRLALDGWPASGIARLKRHPVEAVAAVTRHDPPGEPVVIAADGYRLDRRSRPACLDLRASNGSDAANGIEIDFTAGFGPSAADVPATLKRAVLLLAAHFYEFRATYGPGDQPVSFPAGLARLLAPWRRERL